MGPRAGAAKGRSRPVVLVGAFAETRDKALAALVAEHTTRLGLAVRHTSRARADGEEDGVHYHFASKAELEEAIAAGRQFVEYACVDGEYYATSHAAVAAVTAARKACVLTLDAQTAELAAAGGFDATFVLLLPPSPEALETRLRAAGLRNDDLAAQLARAAHEVDLPERLPGVFAHVIAEGSSPAETAALIADAIAPRAAFVVICGPSGVGKGTLIGKLLQDFPDDFGFCVSHTTRAPRPGEVDGVHYHFASKAAMAEAIERGEFVEHALVHGIYYGTSKAAVENVTRLGKSCILDLDVQGARAIKAAGGLDGATFIFVAPPSLDELEARLRARGTDTEDTLRARLANARTDLAAAKEPGLFDHVVVNNELERAYRLLRQRLTGVAPPVVICGPSGVGKGTLIGKLLHSAPDDFGFCVSHTTRAPRPGEVDGVHYHFASKAAMAEAIERGEFVEHALVHGNYYGTSKAAVDAVARLGKSCILDIDVQGAHSVRASGMGAVFIFVAPPSLDELEARLRGRKTESEEKMALRLANARTELAAAKEPGLFDHVVVNDELTATFCHLRELLTGMAPPVLICGPSGVGKGTLIGKLLQDFQDDFGFCVSHTTRAPRPGEVDGVHYHFASKAAMAEAIERGEFVEHALVHGNYYGTSKAAVENVTRLGKSCILDLDVQGARNVRGSALGAVFIFVAPPSLVELEARLRGRGTETEEKVALRLANARTELTAADEPGFFDHKLINDDLDDTYVALKRTISHYRTLHFSQPLIARGLGRLTPDLPPPMPAGECAQSAYQIGQHALSLRGCYASDASLVARCVSLHMLDLSHNKLSSLQPLGALRHLLVLDASFNTLDAAGALFDPPLNLQELNLSHNRVRTASAVSAHRQLRTLDLSHNALESLDGLGTLECLAELCVESNGLRSVGGLDGAPLLATVRAAHNAIERLDGLPALAHLTALDVSDNLLSSLAGLHGCSGLMDLHAGRNAVANSNEMRHVAHLALLRTLDLSDNPVVHCGSEAVPYRVHVAQQLPSLVSLDGEPVSAEEKVGAAWHFGAADAELRRIRDKHLPAEGILPAPPRPRVPLSAS